MARFPALFCLTCGRIESVPGRPASLGLPKPVNEEARTMAAMNALFQLLSPAQQAILMDNVAAAMHGLPPAMQQRQVDHFGRTDPAYGAGLAARLGLPAPGIAEKVG
ncbi:MAG: catalase-related domain-containing protein [Azospirillaceae bacterium]|nr:catalase-related domain-containing protein [Azospirillaceae bacterium]